MSRSSSRTRALALAAGAALALAACGSGEEVNTSTTAAATTTTGAAESVTTAAPTTVAATTTTEAAPAPLDTSRPGPFAVGHRTVQIAGDPARNRPLTVDIWYPVEAATTTGTKARYELLPGVGVEAALALAGAPAAEGSFPLVVYSHGSGGLRYIAAYSTEHLASWGFVVASADHTGNTAVEQILGTSAAPEDIARNRPADVSQVIDGMVALDATAGDLLAGRIDTADGVGVYGHSLGGYTSLAVAAGVTLPDGTVVTADPRVRAIGLIAPATGRIPTTDLARLTQPFLVIAGTADDVTPIDPNVTAVWATAPGRPRYRVDLTGVGHDVFTDICRYAEAVPTFVNPPQPVVDTITERAAGSCTAPAPDWRAVHTAEVRPLAAFFLTQFGADAATVDGAQAALDELIAPTGGQPGGEVELTP